jgi:hypothetical protein
MVLFLAAIRAGGHALLGDRPSSGYNGAPARYAPASKPPRPTLEFLMRFIRRSGTSVRTSSSLLEPVPRNAYMPPIASKPAISKGNRRRLLFIIFGIRHRVRQRVHCGCGILVISAGMASTNNGTSSDQPLSRVEKSEGESSGSSPAAPSILPSRAVVSARNSAVTMRGSCRYG